MRMSLVLPLVLFLLLLISPAYATDYTTDVADGQVSNATPTTNYGSITTMVVAGNITNQTSYVMFNLSALNGTNVTGVNATLHLYHEGWTGYCVNFTMSAYNTSLNWNETNLTWNAQPTEGLMQGNFSEDDCQTVGEWDNWTVSNAVNASITEGSYLVSFKIKLTQSNYKTGNAYWTKEYASTSLRPYLTVNYNVSDCASQCGACGCQSGTSECYTPSIIGSYCDIEDGYPNTIKTVPYSNCTNTSFFACPNDTYCTQVSPIYNFSNSGVFTPANSTWCSGCWFINKLEGWPPHYVTWMTNCYDSAGLLKSECNCYGVYCSNNVYLTNNTSAPNTIPEWTAGCFNPVTGLYAVIVNSTGYNTSIENLTEQYCPDCNLTNHTPTSCSANTSTICYDASCNIVQCSILPSTTCAASYGGQLALSFGSALGVTDCGLSENILAMLASLSLGLVILYATRGGEHSGQAFVFGTLSGLILFTLIAWFPAWVMIVMIVISAYLMARSLGVGGG